MKQKIAAFFLMAISCFILISSTAEGKDKREKESIKSLMHIQSDDEIIAPDIPIEPLEALPFLKQYCEEQQPDREESQGGIYDIYCETDDGSSLTIEMQICSQSDFNDRMVFYSSFPIRNRVGQGIVVKNNVEIYQEYKLPPIYTIGILNFELQGVSKNDRVIRHFSIREDEDGNTQFTDSVHYITVELPKFMKESSNLSTLQDYILYLLKNMGQMKGITKEFQGKGLDKLLETCMFANMKEDVQMQYVRRMMAEKDRIGQLATARIQGLEEGREQERLKNAKSMKARGLDASLIADITGLTTEQIAAL